MLVGAVPTPLAAIAAAPVVAVMALGVIIALGGHATKSRAVVATGLAILFLGTAGMIVAGYAAYHQDPNDPRPCTVAGC